MSLAPLARARDDAEAEYDPEPTERSPLLRFPAAVASRLRTFLLGPKIFVSGYLRSVLMSALMALNITDVFLYRQLRDGVKFGLMPWYTVDAVIMCVATMEAVVAPIIAWWGWQRRRWTLMAWFLAPALLIWTMVLLPEYSVYSDSQGLSVPSSDSASREGMCRSNGLRFEPEPRSLASPWRALLVGACALVAALARQATISHGLAYLDEHEPQAIGAHIGAVMVARVGGLAILPRLLDPALATWLAVLGGCAPLLLSTLQLWTLPQRPPGTELAWPVSQSRGRNYFKPLGGVLSRRDAMVPICGMALLCAALWGFLYLDPSIQQALYHTPPFKVGFSALTEAISLKLIIIPVLLLAAKQSPPMRAAFSSRSCTAYALVFSAGLVAIYAVLALSLRCPLAPLAGLSPAGYVQPACSNSCGCARVSNEFSPVCLVSTFNATPTTYVTACHAGCYQRNTVNNLDYYWRCQCSANGTLLNENSPLPEKSLLPVAVPQACASDVCTPFVTFHRAAAVGLCAFTVLLLQLLGTMLLRAVDDVPHGRGVALGCAGAAVAVVTFGAGHALYTTIAWTSCAWLERDRCLLYKPRLALCAGATSALLAAGCFAMLLAHYRRLGKQKQAEKLIEMH